MPLIDLTLNLIDITSEPFASSKVFLYPLVYPITSSNSIVVGNPITASTDSTGSITFSRLVVPNTYRADCISTQKVKSIYLDFDDTVTGSINGKDYVVAPVTNTVGQLAFTKQQSDSRYVRLTQFSSSTLPTTASQAISASFAVRAASATLATSASYASSSVSASFATSASFGSNATSASYALTSSIFKNASSSINNLGTLVVKTIDAADSSFTVDNTGNVIANEVSAALVFSTVFQNSSFSVNGDGVITAPQITSSLHGTASWARNVSTGSIDLLRGIVGYFKLDEEGGARNNSVAGYKVTALFPSDGNGPFADGKIGKALSTPEGNSVYLAPQGTVTGEGFAITSSRTLSVFVKANDTASFQHMVGSMGDPPENGGQYHLFINTGSVFFGIVESGSLVIYKTSSSIDNNWHHLVATYDYSTKTGSLYKDNIFVGSFGVPNGVVPLTNQLVDFTLGANDNTSFGFWGLTDELGIWDRVLNRDEITFLNNNGYGVTYPFNFAVSSSTAFSSSFSSLAATASFVTASNVRGIVTSASYAPVEPAYSASVVTQLNGKQATLTTASVLNINQLTASNGINIAGTFSGLPAIKANSIEIQPFSLSNGFITENAFFASGWKYRQTGPAGLFYFFGEEGQFRFFANGTAGSALISGGDNTQIKINSNGSVALGGNMSSAKGVFTDAAAVFNATSSLIRTPLTASNSMSLGGYIVPITQASSSVVSASTSVNIPFTSPMPNTRYAVSLTPSATITNLSYSGKTNGGFTASFGTYTGNLDWIAVSVTQ